MAAYLARDFARFYDWTNDGILDDVPFYAAMARRHGNRALVLACGTGRIAIPLAREGIEVVGIDLSSEMLALAEEKLAREPSEVRSRVRLIQANMKDFDLGEKLAVAFIPQASFFHLHNRRDQVDCLTCASRHLLPGGVLVVDLIPADRMADQTVGQRRTVRSGVCAATGNRIEELNCKLCIDRQAQCVTVEHTYIEETPDGSESRYVFVQDYTWVTEGQMRTMLWRAGFHSPLVLGSYDGDSFSSGSDRAIFVAEKPPATASG
jgi:SAM-dependent methyltransferase